MFPLILSGQLALIGMNPVEAQETFSQKGTFQE
jgi:hypothetical protein